MVELPRPLWWLVLNLLILNTRPKRSAAAYKKIWTAQGSPLMLHSLAQQKGLESILNSDWNGQVKLSLAMRYGQPSIASGLRSLAAEGVDRVLILPAYPQYSATTTASIFDEVAHELSSWRNQPELRFIKTYHDNTAYIAALANSIRRYWQSNDEPDMLVMSFHGIPQAYFEAGDPYYCYCQKTARLLAESLQLDPCRYRVTFQSRLGPKKWLEPYTDKTLSELANQGVANVHVICPGFSVDCLETLEEVAMENRDVFLSSGGSSYGYIPCLNDSTEHLQVLNQLIKQQLTHWVEEPADDSTLEMRRSRAASLGKS
ncbi:MAG: ferrochelatase [Parasphingorhabdus sp.]